MGKSLEVVGDVHVLDMRAEALGVWVSPWA
jgi:hypothetical protein